MHRDPFTTLGISYDATLVEARQAYRRLALAHHPDLNPGDPTAPERFKAVLRAYRAIASGAARKRGAPSTPPPGPRPDRYGCGRCGDSFPFPEQCPRCDVALCDRTAGRPVAEEDPRVRALELQLDARPTSFDPPWEERLPIPAILVMSCLSASLVVFQLGVTGVALLFAGFAIYVAAVEAYRRALEHQSARA